VSLCLAAQCRCAPVNSDVRQHVNRRTRLRRTGILSLHCLRNAAYYRAWNAAPVARRQEQFWITLNGNFVDTCLLEWCKLFGDLKAKHHWSRCVTDSDPFLDGLHVRIGMDAAAFEVFRLEVRAYRDKFVAHLDELNDIEIPRIQPVIGSVRYLYQHLVDVEDDVDAFVDAPTNANTHYRQHLLEARAAHQA
jgi:hypothetical protein